MHIFLKIYFDKLLIKSLQIVDVVPLILSNSECGNLREIKGDTVAYSVVFFGLQDPGSNISISQVPNVSKD